MNTPTINTHAQPAEFGRLALPDPDPTDDTGRLWAGLNHDPLPGDDPVIAARFTSYSSTASCSRQIAYRATGAPVSNKVTDRDRWNWHLGHLIHADWQERAGNRLTDDGWDVDIEVETIHGDLVWGFADLVARRDDRVVTVEGKSAGGFGFKSQIGASSRPAEGLSLGHAVQAAMSGAHPDIAATETRVAVWAKEAVSPALIRRHGLADLLLGEFPAVEYIVDDAAGLADWALARLAGIRRVVESGFLPRRTIPGSIPDGAEIVSAATGTWQELDGDGVPVRQGDSWQCRYCRYQAVCHAVGPGRVALPAAAEVIERGDWAESPKRETPLMIPRLTS